MTDIHDKTTDILNQIQKYQNERKQNDARNNFSPKRPSRTYRNLPQKSYSEPVKPPVSSHIPVTHATLESLKHKDDKKIVIQSQKEEQWSNEVEEDADVSEVYLAFTNYKSGKSETWMDSIVNFLSYTFNGNLIHVEPVFVMKGKQTNRVANHAFNVKTFQGVKLVENKDFLYKRKDWSKRKLNCTPEQREAMYRFCMSKNGMSYDMNGLTRYILPGFMQPPRRENTWNCVSFTLSMMKQVYPSLDEFDVEKVTVPQLFDIGKDNGLYIVALMPKPGQVLP